MSSNDRERDTCRPRFYIEAVENKALSEKEGRPIYEDREFVELRQPGDKNWSWVGSVDDPIGMPGNLGATAKERFPEHYAAFKRNEMRAAIGTPLEQWPVLTRSRVAELKAAHIFTVEEFAGVPDNMLSKLGMGVREEREKARAWLDAASGNAHVQAQAAQIAQLQEQVARLLAANGGAVVPATPPATKAIEECSDAELKEFIKRVSGEGVRGNPSRDTLIARARELATADAEAA